LFIAFSGWSSVILYFLARLADSLRLHEMELREAQRRQAVNEKMEALGTLAAGAAHELATPLSTIAVVAREVEKAIESHACENFDRETVDDIHLIRRELDRCRTILDRMSMDAGQSIAEAVQSVSWSLVRDETLAGLHDADRIDWGISGDQVTGSVHAPLVGLGQALRGLIQNGLDASTPSQRVAVEISGSDPESWTIAIRDRGEGMTREIASRAGQPFFTTKPPGKGMGLGVFLADSLIRRLGGRMEVQSQRGTGTIVTIKLPRRS
jgi:two-component system sensor histidine kinase RegB